MSVPAGHDDCLRPRAPVDQGKSHDDAARGGSVEAQPATGREPDYNIPGLACPDREGPAPEGQAVVCRQIEFCRAVARLRRAADKPQRDAVSVGMDVLRGELDGRWEADAEHAHHLWVASPVALDALTTNDPAGEVPV